MLGSFSWVPLDNGSCCYRIEANLETGSSAKGRVIFVCPIYIYCVNAASAVKVLCQMTLLTRHSPVVQVVLSSCLRLVHLALA